MNRLNSLHAASPVSTTDGKQPAEDGWRFAHERSISVRCTEHVDGRIRAVGLLVDDKGIPVMTYSGKTIGEGEAMHRLRVELLVRVDLIIESLDVEMIEIPGDACRQIREAYQALRGTLISKGFSRIVRERLGGVSGCVHLNNLILQMAPVIMQAHYARFLKPQHPLETRAKFIATLDGSCHIFDSRKAGSGG